MCLVERVDYNGGQVGVKSFNWKYSKSSLKYFLNELVTFKIIQGIDRESILTEVKETLKCPYIAEYVGFMLHESADPFYGSIVTKWYAMGDLSTFTRHISNPKWFAKTGESTKEESNHEYAQTEKKRENMPKEITELVELARQIAEGFILKIFYIHGYILNNIYSKRRRLLKS